MMARPRTPVAKAKATAADVKNPGRHKARRSPGKAPPLGGASMHLPLYAKRAFEMFKRELPWLKESHRLLVEMASIYRADLIDPAIPVVGLQRMQELRRCLSQLGATPADESKVTLPDDGDEDPEAELFSAPPTRAH